MTNQWLAGAVAVFFFGATLGATPAIAGSVVISGGATVCTSYASVSVNAAGDLTINTCTTGGGSASTNATFAVGAASTTATTGTPLAVTVTRTIGGGGTAGNDTLTLTSTVGGAFTPATVSFTTADGSGAVQKTSSINFSATGSATLSATGAGAGNTVTGSSAVTVSGGGGGSCSGITPPGYITEQPGTLNPAAAIGGGTHTVDMGSTSEGKPIGAFHFTVPLTPPTNGSYRFDFIDGGQGGNYGKDIKISACPGDISGTCATGTASGSDPLIVPASASPSGCNLVLGNTYYMTVRHKIATPMGFVLNVGPNQ